VAITPASGYVAPWAAIIIGAAAGFVCYGAVLLKGKLGYDDSLDAFGVHGVGGFLGAVLTGVFCSLAFNPAGAAGGLGQAGKQLVAALSAAAIAGVGTLILMYAIDKVIGFRMARNEEIEGMDGAIHGEQGWMLDQTPAPAMEVPGSYAVEPVAAPKIRETSSI
jgi:Amt family ammonium transporter